MPQFGKDEVRKEILEQIRNLCSQNQINYIGKTVFPVADKHFCFKEIKNPTVFLNKESYSVGENISFEGSGAFIFIDREDSQQKSSTLELSDFKFSGNAMLSTDNKGTCIISINDKTLSIISSK